MRHRKPFDKQNCPLRSDCRREADKKFFRALFERDWEVFVIREDPATGGLRGQTLCCDVPLNTSRQASVCC